MRTIDQMVQQEVLCCMSSLVAAMAEGDQFMPMRKRDYPIAELCAQALELASPIADYEEAAIQVGWYLHPEYNTWVRETEDSDLRADREEYGSAQDLCDKHDIEPYDCEVFEHWAVTEWFAEKLEAAGEKVDKDFGNLCIWARTTTGQGIAQDGVVQRIYADMMKLVEA